jgi:hypothetical protein
MSKPYETTKEDVILALTRAVSEVERIRARIRLLQKEMAAAEKVMEDSESALRSALSAEEPPDA